MSKRGREGKRVWRARRPVLAREISERIAADSAERIDGWVRSGRVPLWIRVKARLRGRRIDTCHGGGSR